MRIMSENRWPISYASLSSIDSQASECDSGVAEIIGFPSLVKI